MPTNLALDDALINEAVQVGHHSTKKAAVNAALKEYILRHRQQKILKLFNSIDYDADYKYKHHRKRKKDNTL